MPSPPIWLLAAIISLVCSCARSPESTPELPSNRDAALGGPLDARAADARPTDAGPDDAHSSDLAPDAAPADARPDGETDAAVEIDAAAPCPTFAAPPDSYTHMKLPTSEQL